MEKTINKKQEIAVYLHASTEGSWQAMLAAIEGAKESIHIEEYIFSTDTIGSRFLSAIIKKAAEGVKIKILCDMVGSLSLYLSDIPGHLREKGIEVAFFNPISLWRLGNITSHFFRDHRKILIVDRTVGFLGGVGIEDRMKDWRDTMVQINGAFVADVEYVFDLVWKRVTEGKYRRFRQRPSSQKDFEILINSPRFRQRFVYRRYIKEIKNAKKYIDLATPYFVPDMRFLRTLRKASERGIKIRLIIPEVSYTQLLSYVQSWYITQVLKAGIKVYQYKKSFFHAKTAVIDDMFATVGSSNLDNLSFLYNHEINLVGSDSGFIADVKKQFEKDLEHCEEIIAAKWQKRFFLKKILEVLTWPFHGFV